MWSTINGGEVMVMRCVLRVRLGTWIIPQKLLWEMTKSSWKVHWVFHWLNRFCDSYCGRQHGEWITGFGVWHIHARMLRCFSYVQLFATVWPNASGGLTRFSPPSELEEIPVATREQSGVRCVHSRWMPWGLCMQNRSQLRREYIIALTIFFIPHPFFFFGSVLTGECC